MRGHMLPVALSADPPVRSYCATAALALPCVLVLVLSPLRPVPARRRMHTGRSTRQSPRAMAFCLDEYPAVALLMGTGEDGSFGVLGHGYLPRPCTSGPFSVVVLTPGHACFGR